MVRRKDAGTKRTHIYWQVTFNLEAKWIMVKKYSLRISKKNPSSAEMAGGNYSSFIASLSLRFLYIT